MSAHVFHEIYLHITWHTKDDWPLLKGDVEKAVHDFLSRRCTKARGVSLQGVGGTDTHIHLAMRVEPFVSISDLVGDLKGACSREINKQKRFKALYWQRGFGVVSFGQKNLRFVLAYIGRQREHHANGSVHDRLERTAGDEVRGAKEDREA